MQTTDRGLAAGTNLKRKQTSRMWLAGAAEPGGGAAGGTHPARERRVSASLETRTPHHPLAVLETCFSAHTDPTFHGETEKWSGSGEAPWLPPSMGSSPCMGGYPPS